MKKSWSTVGSWPSSPSSTYTRGQRKKTKTKEEEAAEAEAEEVTVSAPGPTGAVGGRKLRKCDF